MKKQIIILFAIIFSFIAVSAQDSYIKNRWNIKAGYASYPGVYISGSGFKMHYGNYRLEANYGVLNFLEVGGYLGYSRMTSYLQVVGTAGLYEDLNTPFFGANINLQLLPFIVKSPDFRFDLYLMGRYGGLYYSSPENYYPYRGLHFEYQHGAGVAFYIWKHVGVFTEYGFSKFDIGKGIFRYGLSVKF